MIVGIDFSLTSTGVCAITNGKAECITVHSKKEPEWHEFPARIHGIAQRILDWVGDENFEDTQFVIETPAFMAKSSTLDKMFGGWWLLTDHISRYSHTEPLLRVTPQQVKKYATSKGNANKDAVLAAVIRRYPEVPTDGNDQADALVLAAIGAAVYGEPFGELTQYQQEVVDTVRIRADKGADLK